MDNCTCGHNQYFPSPSCSIHGLPKPIQLPLDERADLRRLRPEVKSNTDWYDANVKTPRVLGLEADLAALRAHCSQFHIDQNFHEAKMADLRAENARLRERERLLQLRIDDLEYVAEAARALVTVLRWHVRHDPADEYMDKMPQLLALEALLAEHRDA